MTAPQVEPGVVRTRFCPSPTGMVHVGLMRTALFNWAHARHTGGTLVFRIEDTDAARDSEESYRHLLDSLRWLGLDWDEGPEVGGPHGPYRQSERHEIYRDVAAQLLAAGHAYESFSTNEEVDARRLGRRPGPQARLRQRTTGTSPTRRRRRSGTRAAQPVLRLRMPDEDLVWTDLVRGEVRFAAGSVPDFVLVRGNGAPLYPFVNPVDDALMEITDVLRGEDLLPSTPRQLALYAALTDIGVAAGTPRFGHLPYVMGEGNKKLSKRDPQSNLDVYRERGFLPEGLANYLALLGWSIAEDRDVFSPGRAGRGLRRHPGQRQPGPLRPEEGRGDQRHPPARAAGRGVHRPGRALPGRRRAWSADPPTAGAAPGARARSRRWRRSG